MNRAPHFRFRFLFPSLVLSLFAFLLIPPWSMAGWDLVFPSAPDEWNYLSHATVVAYGRTNYNLETAEYMPFNHAMGAPLLAAPVVFLFSLVDRIRHNPVVAQRTHETLQHSWTGLGFPVATQIYAVLGTFLLYVLLDRFSGARFPATTAILSVAASGVLFYAYKRPINRRLLENIHRSLRSLHPR